MAKKKAAPKVSVTTVVGEEKAPTTTLALGEEHIITTLVGEEAGPHPDFRGLHDPGDAVPTTVVGEEWHLRPITTIVGEETTIVGEHPITTLVAGEEGPGGGTGGGAFGSY